MRNGMEACSVKGMRNTYSMELLEIQLTVMSAQPSSLGDTSDWVCVSFGSGLL